MGRMGNILWWSEGEDCKSSPLLPIGKSYSNYRYTFIKDESISVHGRMGLWMLKVYRLSTRTCSRLKNKPDHTTDGWLECVNKKSYLSGVGLE